jgi:hypothetical protein
MDYKLHSENIKNFGYTIIKNGVNLDLVDKVVKDFDEWSSIPENKFKKFKFNRVLNFHTYNVNTLDLATNTHVNEILKLFFNKEQVIYTSLFFREGTSQQYHRDTPHFYTNPIDQYCGVWYALEDIDVKAGPLKYCIGSHKLEVPCGHEIWNILYDKETEEDSKLSYVHKNLKALIKYNKTIENMCIEKNLTFIDENNYINNKINKGDIIIWHPKLLHGGSDILDNTLTRYSMVTHNIPIYTKVFNSSHFFTKEPTKEYIDNKFLYIYTKHNNINIVDHGGCLSCKVQESYL